MSISSIYGIFALILMGLIAVFKEAQPLKQHLKKFKVGHGSLGLVPTMGALHEGHLSLVSRAVQENEIVVVSIFVNPTQFNNQEDLEKYPSTFKEDVKLLSGVSEQIVVFAPTKESIYQGKIEARAFSFEGLDQVMEGKFRPGHFNGVATIVKLLFDAVEPDKAYFGEKDFQQLQIIKKLVALEEVTVELVACPIEREGNGLARSSRNERLSKKVREKAGFIHDSLQTAKSRFGTVNAKEIIDWVKQQFAKNELFELEYFEIADIETLRPIEKKEKKKKYRAFIAVYAENVRLIDNIALNY